MNIIEVNGDWVKRAPKMTTEAKAKARKILGETFGWKCRYCRKDLTPDSKTGDDMGFEYAELDHILPVSRGGGNNIENLALCCCNCNGAKRDKTENEYLQVLYGS